MLIQHPESTSPAPTTSQDAQSRDAGVPKATDSPPSILRAPSFGKMHRQWLPRFGHRTEDKQMRAPSADNSRKHHVAFAEKANAVHFIPDRDAQVALPLLHNTINHHLRMVRYITSEQLDNKTIKYSRAPQHLKFVAKRLGETLYDDLEALYQKTSRAGRKIDRRVLQAHVESRLIQHFRKLQTDYAETVTGRSLHSGLHLHNKKAFTANHTQCDQAVRSYAEHLESQPALRQLSTCVVKAMSTEYSNRAGGGRSRQFNKHQPRQTSRSKILAERNAISRWLETTNAWFSESLR